MARAQAVATRPSGQDTSNRPAATAPAMAAWSLGNDGSAVLLTSTRALGCTTYGRDSATCLMIGWLTATASKVDTGANSAAAMMRAGRERAIHHAASSNGAKKTS